MKPRTMRLNAHRTLHYYLPEDVERMLGEVRREPAQPAALAVPAEPAPERVRGAPKDGRECYPTCDCETEALCDYGTKPAEQAQQPAALAAPEVDLAYLRRCAENDSRWSAQAVALGYDGVDDALESLAKAPPAALAVPLDGEALRRAFCENFRNTDANDGTTTGQWWDRLAAMLAATANKENTNG